MRFVTQSAAGCQRFAVMSALNHTYNQSQEKCTLVLQLTPKTVPDWTSPPMVFGEANLKGLRA